MKTCCWCRRYLPLEDFRVETRRQPDRRMRRCRPCDNVYRACKRAIRPRLRPHRRTNPYEGAITPGDAQVIDSLTVRGERWSGSESAFAWAKRLCGGV